MWGENPEGEWKVYVRNNRDDEVSAWLLKFTG